MVPIILKREIHSTCLQFLARTHVQQKWGFCGRPRQLARVIYEGFDSNMAELFTIISCTKEKKENAGVSLLSC